MAKSNHPSAPLLDRLADVRQVLRFNRPLPSWAKEALLAWLDHAHAVREVHRRSVVIARVVVEAKLDAAGPRKPKRTPRPAPPATEDPAAGEAERLETAMQDEIIRSHAEGVVHRLAMPAPRRIRGRVR